MPISRFAQETLDIGPLQVALWDQRLEYLCISYEQGSSAKLLHTSHGFDALNVLALYALCSMTPIIVRTIKLCRLAFQHLIDSLDVPGLGLLPPQ
jgi:hypothetical protein